MIIILLFVFLTIIIHKPSVTDIKEIENSKVKLNRGNYVFNLLNNLEEKPNSFIFGGSRSQAIRADSLNKKTNHEFDFFHFDSSTVYCFILYPLVSFLQNLYHLSLPCLWQLSLQ